MAETPKDIKGAVIINLRLTANPGKADAAAQLLAKLKARADSDAEPGTLQYEIVRFGDEFVAWEKYVDAAAVEAHGKSELYNELMQSGFFQPPKEKGFFFPTDSLPPPQA